MAVSRESKNCMTETADIVVVGGGCIGAAIALPLAEKCAGKILLLEQKDIANGASGKGIGIICTHYTHPTLAKLAYQSLQRFQHFAEHYGGQESGFNPCGYYVLVSEADVETLSSLVNQHQSFGINTGLVDLQQVKAAIPIANISDVAAAAYEPDSGYGDPLQTTRAFAQRAIELGVEVRIHTPVTAIRLDIEGRIEAVVTPQGAIATRTVVDCVGAWARQFTAAVDLPFPVTPVVEHVVLVERSSEFDTESSASHPVISDLVNLCYLRSAAHHPYTCIGNSDPRYHAQFCLDTANQFEGQLFPDICETLHQKLVHRMPSLATSPVIQTYWHLGSHTRLSADYRSPGTSTWFILCDRL